MPISREDKKLINDILKYRSELVAEQQNWVTQFTQLFHEVPQITIEKQSQDIHDLETLSQIGKRLLSLEHA